MNTSTSETKKGGEEYPDSWWHQVYVGVVAATILVIALLWAFSRYFS